MLDKTLSINQYEEFMIWDMSTLMNTIDNECSNYVGKIRCKPFKELSNDDVNICFLMKSREINVTLAASRERL